MQPVNTCGIVDKPLVDLNIVKCSDNEGHIPVSSQTSNQVIFSLGNGLQGLEIALETWQLHRRWRPKVMVCSPKVECWARGFGRFVSLDVLVLFMSCSAGVFMFASAFLARSTSARVTVGLWTCHIYMIHSGRHRSLAEGYLQKIHHPAWVDWLKIPDRIKSVYKTCTTRLDNWNLEEYQLAKSTI